MHDVKFIVSQPNLIKEALTKRNMGSLGTSVDRLLALDRQRRELIQQVETLKHERNQASQEIAKKKKEKNDASFLLSEMKTVSDKITAFDLKVSEIEKEMEGPLYDLPNLLAPEVPVGKSSEENKEVRRWGTIPVFSFSPRSHFEIGEKMGCLDFKKAGEVTGARFVFLKGVAARIERLLIDLMLNTHIGTGYEEIQPPFLVNRNALVGTGQFPKFVEDVFKVEGFEFFLIPTAEVPVTNYHRDEILEESALPKKYVAYTPCFRSEAGSYGKDTKGLKRQHQFNKVELVKFTKPENSDRELESLLADAEKILQILKLPYRVVLLCSGDISFSSRKTYDIEVWSPFMKNYVEISSCSNFGDFQARRAGIRFRDPVSKKVQYVHTLNGSGLAVGRTLLAIMENYQTADGKFSVPEALGG